MQILKVPQALLELLVVAGPLSIHLAYRSQQLFQRCARVQLSCFANESSAISSFKLKIISGKLKPTSPVLPSLPLVIRLINSLTSLDVPSTPRAGHQHLLAVFLPFLTNIFSPFAATAKRNPSARRLAPLSIALRREKRCLSVLESEVPQLKQTLPQTAA